MCIGRRYYNSILYNMELHIQIFNIYWNEFGCDKSNDLMRLMFSHVKNIFFNIFKHSYRKHLKNVYLVRGIYNIMRRSKIIAVPPLALDNTKKNVFNILKKNCFILILMYLYFSINQTINGCQ